jgi:uncharacterized protein
MAAPTQAGNGQRSTRAPERLRELIRRHPLFAYFSIAYAFSWITLIPYILSSWGWLPGNWTIAFVIHTFGPAVAAISVVGTIEGKAGVNRLRQRVRQWRVGWPWYLFTVVGIQALFLLGIVIQPGGLASFRGLAPVLLASYPLTYVAVLFGGGPLGEEIGWRGFALPRMQPRYGPLKATLLLGVLWTGWHLADFVTPSQGGGTGSSLSTFLTNFSIFLLVVVALSIILTWIFNHTRGSILMAILAHASVDNPQAALVPTVFAVGVTTVNLAGLIGFVVPAILILVLTRGRLGYRPSQDLENISAAQLPVAKSAAA